MPSDENCQLSQDSKTDTVGLPETIIQGNPDSQSLAVDSELAEQPSPESDAPNPDDLFEQAANYVLTKNRELYERLS